MTTELERFLATALASVYPLRYAVLRNAESLPRAIPGTDIDVIVHPADKRVLIDNLVRSAELSDWTVVWTYQTSLRMEHLVFAPRTFDQSSHASQRSVVRFDVLSVWGWRDCRLLDASLLLPFRIERHGVWQLDELSSSTVAVLGRWLHVGEAPERYLVPFDIARRAEPERFRSLVAAALGGEMAKRLQHGERPSLRALRIAARRRALRRPLTWLRDRAWYTRYAVSRVLRPPGRFVVFLGAHGSGKSTLVAGLAEAARPAVPHVRTLHLRPRLLPDLAEVRRRFLRRPRVHRTEVHLSDIPEASRAGSTVRLLYYALDYVLGYARRIAPVRMRAGLVVADRWHYDFAVDQASKRIGLPPSLVRGLLRLLPDPDLVILVTTPGDVAEARRPTEIHAAEADRQTAAFRSLLQSLGHPFIEVDASTEAASAVAIAWRATLACFADADPQEAVQ